MRPSNEPFFWAMFSAGGVIIALLMPVLIIITGFVVPAGGVDFDRLDALFGDGDLSSGAPLVRLIIFGVAFFTFMHAAHRIRHTLKDLGLRSIATPLAVVCYLARAGRRRLGRVRRPVVCPLAGPAASEEGAR